MSKTQTNCFETRRFGGEREKKGEVAKLDPYTFNFFINLQVLVIGIVGAFTSVCQNQLPPFAEKLADFKKKGIQDVVVV
jgi:peroxiredoxin